MSPQEIDALEAMRDERDQYRMALEAIALGESENPAEDAEDTLVELGHWRKEAVTEARATRAAVERAVSQQLQSMADWHAPSEMPVEGLRVDVMMCAGRVGNPSHPGYPGKPWIEPSTTCTHSVKDGDGYRAIFGPETFQTGHVIAWRYASPTPPQAEIDK